MSVSVKVVKKKEEGNLLVFEVRVDEGGSVSSHQVSVDKGYTEKLGYDFPGELVEKSFEFLLSREPKEAILAEFNLREISRYFPEFEEKIKK